MQHLRSLITGLSLLFLSFAVQAVEGIYDIEMVIFEQPANDDTEAFPDDIEAPDLTQAVALINKALSNDTMTTQGIERLPARDGKLGPAVYTLNRKGAHVVTHLRWRQQIARSTRNPWYRIQGDHLDGLIRLNRGRYIHLDTDLLLDQSDRAYRVQEHARSRSGELYYVDHPKLGILFRADRYEDPNALPETAPVQEQTPSEPGSGTKEQDNPPEQRAPSGELPRAMPDPT